jgi:glycosyltransferase involved in cell wall biosynthesis
VTARTLRSRLGRVYRRMKSAVFPGPSLSKRVKNLEEEIRREQHRIDFALGAVEGVLDRYEDFQAARRTAEYEKAFTETEPLVTVCIATSQRPALLTERCLPSVLGQSYRNLQIVVVGDHCMDDTEARVASLRDSRIQFHNLTERGPYPRPGHARWCAAGTVPTNAALSLAEGQFITHLDDDDRYTSERISVLVEEAQRHRADFCWHRFWMEDWDGTWRLVGGGKVALGQITTGSMFYHRYFRSIPCDVGAYRLLEPSDWNRVRKIKLLRPRLRFVDQTLLFHYQERNQPPFQAQPGERFLD